MFYSACFLTVKRSTSQPSHRPSSKNTLSPKLNMFNTFRYFGHPCLSCDVLFGHMTTRLNKHYVYPSHNFTGVKIPKLRLDFRLHAPFMRSGLKKYATHWKSRTNFGIYVTQIWYIPSL